MLAWFRSLPKSKREHIVAASLAVWWIPTAVTLFWITSSARYQMLRDTRQGIRHGGTDANGHYVETYMQPEELALILLVILGPRAHLFLYSFVFGESDDEPPKKLSRNDRKRLRREARKQRATVKIKPPRRRRRKHRKESPQ